MALLIDPIRVEGLAELRRSLRQVDSTLARALRLAGNKAAKLVVDEAVPTVPRRSGKAAGSMRTRSSQTETRVVSGGNRAPYMPWLDYGGNVGKDNTAHREFIRSGRYVYPAFERVRDEVERTLRIELRTLAESAGLTVEG